MRFFSNDAQVGADWTAGIPAPPSARLAIFGGVVVPTNGVANYVTGMSLDGFWWFEGVDLSKVANAPHRAALRAHAKRHMPSIGLA